MNPSPSTLCPTPSAARAGVPNRDVNRVSHMYTPESSTPASDSGAPTRSMVGTVAQSGASKRINPRRSAMPMPIGNPPPRTITDAVAAPSTPSRGNGPTPAMSTGPRQPDPDVEPGRGHRRERRRPDEPPHPDAVDQVEAEMARHHRHRGRGEAQDDGPERTDGEGAGRAREGGHGDGAAAGTSVRKRWNTELPG